MLRLQKRSEQQNERWGSCKAIGQPGGHRQESIKKCGAVGFNGMGRHSAGSGQKIGGLDCPTLFDALPRRASPGAAPVRSGALPVRPYFLPVQPSDPSSPAPVPRGKARALFLPTTPTASSPRAWGRACARWFSASPGCWRPAASAWRFWRTCAEPGGGTAFFYSLALCLNVARKVRQTVHPRLPSQ